MFSFFNKNKKPLTAVINDQAIDVLPKETLLNAALRNNIEFPHSCRVGGCAACKCQLTDGQVRELTDAGYILSDDDLDRGYILACQSVPKTDIRIRLDNPTTALQQLDGTIVGQQKLTHDITRLTIRCDTTLPFRPGQFADLTLASLPGISRSYSFASVSQEPGVLEFFVREVPGGQFSERINQQDLGGETINIRGPLGDFWLRPAASPIIMLAGGSGLAPIIAMLQAQLAESRQRPLWLLFGARQQRDLYAEQTLANIQQQWQAPFYFIPVLSEEAESSDWPGERGLVTDPLPRLFADHTELSHSHAYLCGPPAMIDAAQNTLLSLGINATHIYADRFATQADQSLQQTQSHASPA